MEKNYFITLIQNTYYFLEEFCEYCVDHYIIL